MDEHRALRAAGGEHDVSGYDFSHAAGGWKTSRDLALVLQVAVTASLLIFGGATLRGQSTGAVQQGEPFAGFQQSLADKADALLASNAEPMKLDAEDSKEGSKGSGKPDSGAKALIDLSEAAARLKPCPDTSCASSAGSGANAEESAEAGSGRSLLGSAAARVEFLRPAVDPILASHGVPSGMAAAIMLVESGGRADAVSPKGARGLWQLMPDTARRYGLRVDDAQDDRLDLVKATGAAAGYLHDLYARFGDWKLALAAYNAGEANVSAAIFRAQSEDFERLAGLRVLPQETRAYVPKVLTEVGAFEPGTELESQRRDRGTTVFAGDIP